MQDAVVRFVSRHVGLSSDPVILQLVESLFALNGNKVASGGADKRGSWVQLWRATVTGEAPRKGFSVWQSREVQKVWFRASSGPISIVSSPPLASSSARKDISAYMHHCRSKSDLISCILWGQMATILGSVGQISESTREKCCAFFCNRRCTPGGLKFHCAREHYNWCPWKHGELLLGI